MVGTMNQIERIDAVMSAKHIAELEQEITELIRVDGLKQNRIGELARVIARENGELSKSHLSTVKEKQLNSKLKRNIEELNHSHAKLMNQVSNDKYTIDTLRAQLKFERNLVDDFQKSISEKNETIENMEGAIEGDNVELSVRRHDSTVLMDVAAHVKLWNDTLPANRSSHLDMREIYNLLVDYIDVPPVPEIKGTVQNSGTSSIDDDGNSTIVSGPVLEAVRNLFGCYENGEDWILFTREAALEMIDQCNIIDELKQVGHQKDGVILGLQHDCRAKDQIIEETKTDARYLDNKCYDQQHIIYDVQAKLRRANETHEGEFNLLAKKEYSQRDKLKRISALLSDDLPHHHLTSRLSLIESIISEDLS